MKKYFYILLIPFYLLLLPCLAHAQTLRISPALLKIELAPGKTTSQEFLIDNLTSNPLPVKITVEGFDSNDEDFGIKVAEKITTPLAEWISLDITDTIIPAQSQAKITGTISVPSEVPLGGYYAVIFFDPLPNPTTGPIQGDQINARLGAITLANIGISNDHNKAEISEFSFDQNFYNNQSPRVVLRTKNTGLNFFTAKPQITIDPLIGKTQTIEWEEKTILPGKVRRWEKSLSLPNNYGLFYRVKLAVSLENGQYISQTKNIFAFPISTTLRNIAILFILAFSLKHSKRVKKAVSILFEKTK